MMWFSRRIVPVQTRRCRAMQVQSRRRAGAEQVQQSRCRADAEQMLSRCRAGAASRCRSSAELVQSRCRAGAEQVQSRCRAGAEVLQSRCMQSRCKGAGAKKQLQVQFVEQCAEVLQRCRGGLAQRWCRDAGAEQLQREGQMC